MVGKAKCNLILDSCSDLPRRVIDDAEVTFFRFPYNMNDGEHLDDFGVSMTPKEFYDRLRTGEVSGTAQVPIPTITEVFEAAAEEGTPTVYVAFTGGLSGTYETVERVAEDIREKYPDFELYTVDSTLASVAEGLLAYEAIRQRDRGLSAKQLAEWAEEARWFVNCAFTVNELESLRRGGRIPDAAASIGTALNVNPVLGFNLDGSLSMTGMVRGRKKALKALVKAYQDNHAEGVGSDETILLASADAEKDATWVEEHLDRPEDSIPVLRSSIGPTIGSHVGPGMLAIAFWGQDRRKKISVADRIANSLSGSGN